MRRSRCTGIQRVVVLALTSLALSLGAVACGDSGSADESGERTVASYPGHSNDRGPAIEKQRLYELYLKISRAFHDGDAAAVCRSFGTSINSLAFYDALSAEDRLAECERDVTAAMGRGGDRYDWPRRKVRWIRVYIDIGMVAGVTTAPLDGRSGPTMRLQFAKRAGEWNADFPLPDGLEGL
jgi:hypothetical protein